MRCAGYSIHRISPAFARAATAVLAGLLALAALANIASQSPSERFVLGPVALSLAALCLVVLRAGVHGTRREPSRQDRQLTSASRGSSHP